MKIPALVTCPVARGFQERAEGLGGCGLGGRRFRIGSSCVRTRDSNGDRQEKYATDGELQFTLPDVLKVRPISDHGDVNEIIGKFGGADQLRNAVNQLQSLLYAA